MRAVGEKEFRERAMLVGATRFKEDKLDFVGEWIPYASFIKGKKRYVAVNGDKSVSSVAKAMAGVFRKNKLPHGNDANYFRRKLLGKSDLSAFLAVENVARIFLIIVGGLFVSFLSMLVSSQLTGYSTVNIFTFDYIETSVIIGIIVFIASVSVLFKIIFAME